jgi:transmembrane sensor
VNNLDWQQFDRYMAGDMTPEEREQFEVWLAQRPERAAQADEFRRAIELLASDVNADEREAMWAGIIGQPVQATGGRQAPRFSLEAPAPRGRWMAARLAAGIVLVAGMALVGRAWFGRAGHGGLVPERVVSVPRAQQADFRLPDGTAVVLAGGTTLRYPRSFGERSRDVVLEGEATFAVEHDARRPFRVRARDLVATDLGTEFLVRAYPEDPRARVVVRSGTVSVGPVGRSDRTGADRLIRPGELGRLGLDGLATVEPADTVAYFAWTRGTLVFDGMPLQEALPQLSRWYDLEFRLADPSLGSIPLSGTLDRTLTNARLELLAGSLGLQQVRLGRVVMLSRLSATGR